MRRQSEQVQQGEHQVLADADDAAWTCRPLAVAMETLSWCAPFVAHLEDGQADLRRSYAVQSQHQAK
jgi:hypothetical protein